MKKYTLLLPALLLISVLSYTQTPEFTPQAETHHATSSITAPFQKTAFQELIYPDQQAQIFTSEKLYSTFPFTSVALSWHGYENNHTSEGHTHDHSHTQAQIRFQQDQQWTEWIALEEEPDLKDPHYQVAIASTNQAEAFQYRFFLEPGQSIDDISWTFLKTTNESRIASSHDAIQSTSLSQGTKIISRAQWGADESYRYLKPGEELVLAPGNEEFYEKFADELQMDRIIYQDQQGEFKWPLQYPEQVKKIIVHHTATTEDLENPIAAISDIYYYHTNTRGWGDIGYNYIIDKEGNVYEGRYGGEGVIAAHANTANHGSIGIAVLGHYHDTPVPEKSVVSLASLIGKKAKVHNIDPQGKSTFRQEYTDNVLGHRDVSNTTCPGDNLYNKIPVIRKLAAQESTQIPKFVKDYAFQVSNPLYYLELSPFQRQTLTLKLENIGKTDWNQDTFILISNDANNHRLLDFPTSDSYILANQQETLVKPGQTATFTFDLQSKNIGGTAYLQFHPMINGQTKIEDDYTLPVGIIPPVYDFQFISSDFPETQLKAGTLHPVSVTLKNLSNVSWQSTGPQAITLKGSQFNLNLSNQTVSPGQTATFIGEYLVPQGFAGDITHTFTPHIANNDFQNKDTFHFSTRVYDKDLAAAINLVPQVNNFQKNTTNPLTFRLKNVGIQNINTKDLSLNLHTNQDITFSDLTFSKTTLQPTEILEISLNVTTKDQSSGDFFINPLYQEKPLLSAPISINYRTEAPVQTEETIRIKLGFSGIPQISATTDYDIYRNDTFIETKKANTATTISQPNTKIIPRNNGILTIENYENRPAWNQDLNDNQFRGSLEILQDDGQLIVVNELPLEHYLKGLGEVSNSAHPEKIKALMVAARTYAKYYLEVDQKFPGKPYDLDDDPERTQKYLGYGLEKRSPNVSAGVQATAGEVVQYQGKLVKTPYFNQTDGTFTKSAKSVWGWTNTPYLQPADDSLCDGNQFLGHGVGLSGCGATAMAENGSTYQQILKHYYTGIDIVKL